jgi:nucleoside-diphosphate-sugar epimerase
MLIAIALSSGVMLLWPTLKGASAVGLSTADAVQLINREKAVVVDVSEAADYAQGHVNGARSVCVWGSGTPRRELLHSDDMAAACVFLGNLDDTAFDRLFDRGALAPLINIGYGSDLSIAELAARVAAAVGFTGALEFDRNRPDGTPQKLLDAARIRALGWTPAISLNEGLRLTYEDFRARFGSDAIEKI